MKKCLSLVLAFVLVLGTLPCVPASAYSMGVTGENGVMVAAEQNGMAAVDSDGTLWMWGDGINGSNVPVAVMENVAAVSCGQYATAVLTKDGELLTRGRHNRDGILGNGTAEASEDLAPVVGLGRVTAVSVSSTHMAAVTEDGSVWTWGNIGYTSDGTNISSAVPVKVEGIENVKAVSCGDSFTAAITEDGSLWTWGLNLYGKLGNGGVGDFSFKLALSNVKYQSTPLKTSLENVVSVSCGSRNMAVITEDGSLWICGAYSNITGTRSDVYTLKKFSGIENAVRVSCGESHIGVVTSDGSLWMWGNDGYGRLGVDINITSTPQKVEHLQDVVDVNCAGNVFYTTAAITKDGSLYTWGFNETNALGNGGVSNSTGAAVVSGTVRTQTVPLKVLDLIEEIQVFINDVEVEFDQPPVLDPAGRVLVPIRKIAEAMGDEVLWNDEHKAAFILHGDRALIIKLLSDRITIVQNEQWTQWEHKELDVPAMVLSGRTLVPVRAFCESLGAQVKWDGEKQAVYITYDFGSRGEELSAETFSSINTVYYALNSDASGVTELLDAASDDALEFYEQRNHTLDGVAMGLGDIWSGVTDLLSGLSNAESVMKDSIEQMLTAIPDNEIVTVDMKLATDLKDWISSGKSVLDEANGVDAEFLAAHPTLKGLGTAIHGAGVAADLMAFTAEQLAVFLSNYEMNIEYLHTLALTLDENGLLDEALGESLERLETEYANEFVHVMFNLRDKLAEFTIKEGVGLATGGVFSLGEFTWKQVAKVTGLSEKGAALETFYGLFCVNSPLDVSYAAQRAKLLGGEYTAEDAARFKQLDDMQRAAKIKLYESIKNITNDEATQDYCAAQMESLAGSCVLWKIN